LVKKAMVPGSASIPLQSTTRAEGRKDRWRMDKRHQSG
jgi:hypothetical protein